jgi:hypothetical protein
VTARLTRRPGGAARLRALLDSGELIVAPGAFDPLSARLVEEAAEPQIPEDRLAWGILVLANVRR